MVKAALAGKRILVLEDEMLLALDAAASLEAFGALVVGPAHDVERALALVAAEPLDAAMLDVNIRGGDSLAVATALARLGVPILFATGYGATPQGWPKGAIIDKPYTARQMEGAFTNLFAARAG
jgi:CheY-like chemotaxis protein